MSLDEIRNALQMRPFRPFRLFVTDGGSYDVRHPDLCMVGPRIAVVGIQPAGQNEPIIERYVVVDLLHVTRFEPLATPAPPTNN